MRQIGLRAPIERTAETSLIRERSEQNPTLSR